LSRDLLRLPPALALGCLLLCWLLLRFLPYGDLAAFRERPCSTRFYDRTGRLVQIIPLEQGLRREYRPLEEIPPELTAAFVYTEDARFYSHTGVDPSAAFRALVQNMAARRRVSGASTITMQLARLIAGSAGSAPGGLRGKILEAVNALRLEARLSKRDILELYLNSVPFGFQTEGVASAARNFFASELNMLSPAQIFCLTVIPRRPAAYNPITGTQAGLAAAQRLQARFAQGGPVRRYPLLAAVHEEDWSFAVSRAGRFAYPQEMPHLVRHIRTELAAGPRGGQEPGSRSGRRRPAAELTLSVDLALQYHLEGLMAGNIARYYSSRITNGAAIVIDNATGEILAWVGSADYHNVPAAGQIDGVSALNQPGSSMKPFLYAMALEQGFRPADVLADIPMNFGTDALYIPQNFNNRFNGPVRLRAALASSLNIPAVSLLYRLGVRSYIDFLLSLGFNSLESSGEEAGLGLALGNAPVSIAELVRAFSVFPRDGMLIPLSWKRAAGQDWTGDSPPPEPRTETGMVRIMSADTARIICSFLSDRSARVLAFGAGQNFITPFPVMFKTGTANQYQSIAALGATPRYSAAVWMGNFTGETVIGRTGSSIPAAIVRDILLFLQGSSGPDFPEPEQFVKEPVCTLSGMRPSADCPSTIDEYIPRGSDPEPCTWHRASTVVYPAEYQRWFFSLPRQGELDYAAAPLQIITPRDSFVFFSGPGLASGNDSIPVEVIGGRHDELLVEYDSAAFTVVRPFVFYLPHDSGDHVLTVKNGGETETVRFTVE
jgi:penicillin-binding protein 1C